MVEKLMIEGENVLLVGFRAHKNMGDELILLGNINLLLQQKKQISVISPDNNYLKEFLSHFIDIKQISFLQELPRGVRSFFHYVRSPYRKEFSSFSKFDAIILGGGEILTEESPSSYRYRLWSIWPALHYKKTKLYIMGGVQVPKKKRNLHLFKKILKHTEACYLRDFDAVQALQNFWYNKVSFFMDTSFFAVPDWKIYKKDTRENYIVVNLNSNGKQFKNQLIQEIRKYHNEGFAIYYACICQGRDNDEVFAQQLQAELGSEIHLSIVHRFPEVEKFFMLLWGAKKVIGTRLHLFLISSFIGLDTQVYPYQKKIKKMQKTLEKIKLLEKKAKKSS